MPRPRQEHENFLRIRHLELKELTIFQLGVLIKLASMAAVSPTPGYVCGSSGSPLILEEIATELRTTYSLVSKNIELLQNAGFIVLSDTGVSILNWQNWTDGRSAYQRELMRKRRGFVSLTNSMLANKLPDLGLKEAPTTKKGTEDQQNMLANKPDDSHSKEQDPPEFVSLTNKGRSHEQQQLLPIHIDNTIASKEKRVVKGEEDDPTILKVWKELCKLPGWEPAKEKDIDFIYEFKSDYPGYDLTVAEIHQVRNFHADRRVVHNKRAWKNRFHNWAKTHLRKEEKRNGTRLENDRGKPKQRTKHFGNFQPIIAGSDDE